VVAALNGPLASERGLEGLEIWHPQHLNASMNWFSPGQLAGNQGCLPINFFDVFLFGSIFSSASLG
jgi:hypothetical protein